MHRKDYILLAQALRDAQREYDLDPHVITCVALAIGDALKTR